MYEFDQNEYYEGESRNTVSNMGLIVKTLLGVIIAFSVAIPNLIQRKLFLAFIYKLNGFGFILTAIVVNIVLGIIWFTLYNLLEKDKGKFLNLFIYVITCAFAGLFLGNALITAVILISVYGENLNPIDVFNAVQITAMATFIAVIAGVIALPKLHMEEKGIKYFKNASTLLVSLLFVSGSMWLIGYIFAAFGLRFILDFYYTMIYGVGPISIIISVLCVIFAEFLFLTTLSVSKMAVGRAPKHMEYYFSMMLVNGIIRIYIEIFKLVLKFIAIFNEKE